ncbi:fumarylacetoacetate hydrolase family protein [Pseudonocardia kujensis]|uniref:fumarylacetoacetate hydrolase family protein n=1 Tax=Pseudonocardia kujensis TaxID=1128675 RepID=UPI001E317172|nr:fumarylacetoacetate hydrolase family protein [Pseudonocardia kujensis]MCE0765027.1 fumarylacetoacetate hydrolase family protein [Pseudonocardia kujensis]
MNIEQCTFRTKEAVVRWVSYVSPTDKRERIGVVAGQHVHGLAAPGSLRDLIAQGQEATVAAAERAVSAPAEVLDIAATELLAPISVPPSTRDFMSFEAHVAASALAVGGRVDEGWYENPVFYFSNPAATVGPEADIAVAPGSNEIDYELEVAAVIGLAGSDISVEDAAKHIAGYTLLCDWSARDLQLREMRQSLGPAKGKDFATSLGPVLVTPDEIAHLRTGKGYAITMTAEVNGKPYSSGSWADIHWSFEQMVAYASRGTRLVPGDVIGSGTVGTGCIFELARVHGQDRFPYLRPGDEVVIRADHLGEISARIVPGAEPLPLTRL